MAMYSLSLLLISASTLFILSNGFVTSFHVPPAVASSLTSVAAATATTAVAPTTTKSSSTTDAGSDIADAETKDVVTTVVVTGATGRTGRLVVEELLRRDVPKVIAVVRSTEKASKTFPDPVPDNLEIVQCDLLDEEAVSDLVVNNDVDATVWCATGFSNAQDESFVDRMKKLFGMAVAPQKSIDFVGLPAFAKSLSEQQQKDSGDDDDRTAVPKVIMCSSAGVTRTIWDDAKKERLVGAADIPIVRLNPFGILDVKRDSEDVLRRCGARYCIVRPAGLNDEWPSGSRPILSQGDVAVGRINRADVAKVLVDCLSLPEATGKTFEVIAVADYPPPVSIAPALARLRSDDEPALPEEYVQGTYSVLQQLLPGEKQNSAALAMGQTYEEYDKGKVGRLGERGQENAQDAAPKPSN